MGFDVTWPGGATVAVLLFFRLAGLMIIAPIFSARALPVQWRAAVLVVLTVLMAGVGYHFAGPNVVLSPTTLVSETVIGFGIGIGAALVVAAAETAGEMMAIQMGLSGGQLMDPMSGVGTAALGTFMNMAVVTVMLSLNVHLSMLEALATSLRVVPLGTAVHLSEGLWGMLGLAGTLFSVGLRLAAPVLCVVLLVNVALAVLSRAAPSLNVLSLAFPVQIALGLFAFATSWPYLAIFLRDWPFVWDQQITTFFHLLLP